MDSGPLTICNLKKCINILYNIVSSLLFHNNLLKMDYSKIQHEQNLTLILNGKTSVLKVKYFPPIILNLNYSYSMGLNYFTTYHSIFNITKNNNKFKCYKIKKNTQLIAN